MPPINAKRSPLIKAVTTILIVAVAGFLYWQKQRSPSAAPTANPSPAQASRSTPAGASSGAANPAASRSSRANVVPITSATTLKIGSWNIEWLGKPEDRGQFAQGVAQSPDTMAAYIAGSGVAVLGVAEVVTTIPGRPLRSRELEATMQSLSKQRGDRWEYALCEGRQGGDQLTGFVWNTSVITALNDAGAPWRQGVDAPWRVPIKEGRSMSGSRLWARPPHAIKFSAGAGKTDFVLIVLHMKADYNGKFAAQRKQEMDTLLEAMPAVRSHFHDEDIVLTGDTNATSTDEPAIADAVASGFIDLNARNISTTWRGSYTDRTFVPSGQPEFASREFWVYDDAFLSKMRWRPGDFKKNLSDHFMVGTLVRIMDDDD